MYLHWVVAARREPLGASAAEGADRDRSAGFPSQVLRRAPRPPTSTAPRDGAPGAAHEAGSAPPAWPDGKGRVTCEGGGGEDAVYWKHVAEDERPTRMDMIRSHQNEGYITYEPDKGGWNNIRMSMELFAMLAISTGRTLVLPPSESFYLLNKKVADDESHKGRRGPKLGFRDFFDLERLHRQGVVMSMEEFLQKEGVPGNLEGGKAPPGGRTDLEGDELWSYLREASPFSTTKHFLHPGKHILAVAPGMVDVPGNDADYMSVFDAPADRVASMKVFAGKREVIDLLADPLTAGKRSWHFAVDAKAGLRWLSHSYTVLFWSDAVQERFWRRFQRDGLRYRNEILCAADRVVKFLRREGGGSYSSYHIRRGDFQFTKAKIPADEILRNSRPKLRDGELLYISTDERDAAFFTPFTAAGYRVLRYGDVAHLVGELPNPNWIGMIEQVISSHGRVFHGTYWSTFTGFIIRMRGYMGLEKDTFYSLKGYYNTMQEMRDRYQVEGGGGWWREWPIAYRDIDAP